MRGRAFKIRQVFAELRDAVGNQIPTIELLRLATKLVDATRTLSVGYDGNFISARPSTDELPLDKAFADGGWGIMARNCAYHLDEFEEDPCSSARTRATLDRLIKRAA